MRKSRVLLAGVAVAAAAAATSAFTASNDVTGITAANSRAGYGQVVVSGVTVTNVTYNPLATDAEKLDSAVFTATGDLSAQKGALTLKSGSTVLGSYTCATPVYDGSANSTITCSTGSPAAPNPANPLFTGFDTVGLTVTH